VHELADVATALREAARPGRPGKVLLRGAWVAAPGPGR
jgi:hypothetical protein